jgi:hypothetical protein
MAPTTPDNLCSACSWCNSFKGTDIAGLDPLDESLTPLFNPRREIWSEHFAWQGPILTGRTAVGRTTISVLKITDQSRIEHRKLLLKLGESLA